MPLIVPIKTQLLAVRVAALLFTCTGFSLTAHGSMLPNGGMTDWCIFCWAFSFACTLLVLLVEQFGLQARAPVSWSNFPITVACYAALLCLSAGIIVHRWFLRDNYYPGNSRGYRIGSIVVSYLATVAYIWEVSLSRAKPGEVAGYMATAPGLLKVCQTFVACIIFILVSEPVLYGHYPALEWCMAVYCICFILSMAVVILSVGECTNFLPIPFSKFLSGYGLLAMLMYLTATIIWPVFQFDKEYKRPVGREEAKIAVAVLTAVNFLLYLADMAYTARLVFVTA